MHTGIILASPRDKGFGFIQPDEASVRALLTANKDLFFHVSDGIFPEGKTFLDYSLGFGTKIVFNLGRGKDGLIKAVSWTLYEYRDLLPPSDETPHMR